MKSLGIIFIGLVTSTTVFAFTPKNPEYASQAVNAATGISSINWGVSSDEKFEVIRESINDDGVHISGKYKVRLFIVDPSGHNKTDGGKDFDVNITDGAVLNVKVDCRLCG